MFQVFSIYPSPNSALASGHRLKGRSLQLRQQQQGLWPLSTDLASVEHRIVADDLDGAGTPAFQLVTIAAHFQRWIPVKHSNIVKHPSLIHPDPIQVAVSCSWRCASAKSWRDNCAVGRGQVWLRRLRSTMGWVFPPTGGLVLMVNAPLPSVNCWKPTAWSAILTVLEELWDFFISPLGNNLFPSQRCPSTGNNPRPPTDWILRKHWLWSCIRWCWLPWCVYLSKRSWQMQKDGMRRWWRWGMALHFGYA